MEITQEIKDNLKLLEHELNENPDIELTAMVESIGYESFGKGIDYEDGTKGVLMQLNEENNTYNNGVYILHKMEDGTVVMEVVVPNTKNKGALITKYVDQISNFVNGVDASDMMIFDHAEAWGQIITEAVITPLAKTLFPDDPQKRERFRMLYIARFLANVAHIYVGDEHYMEEGINSEPYVLKMAIDQGTPIVTDESEDESEDKTEDSTEK